MSHKTRSTTMATPYPPPIATPPPPPTVTPPLPPYTSYGGLSCGGAIETSRHNS
ncbi:hypothetical protein OROMI_001367 [Orobanche minor]